MSTSQFLLQITNNTNTDITSTSVSGVDSYDFIGSKQTVERRKHLDDDSKHSPFTMSLHFRDGTVDTFRIHQKHARLEHLAKAHRIFYERQDHKAVIRVENTERQLQEERIDEKNREGAAAMEKRSCDAVAENLAKWQSASESSTVSSIRSTMSDSCQRMGNIRLAEAWRMETDAAEGAEGKFSEARHLFYQAESMKDSDGVQKMLSLVGLKIDSNHIFNEATLLEKEAFLLLQGAGGDRARSRYVEVLAKYEEAKKKFEEGVTSGEIKFGDCVKIAQEHIDNVKQVIDDIDKGKLNLNIRNVKIDEESQKGVDVD